MQSLLLHTCCAPCSAAVIEWLLGQGIRPTLFYYNPNIFPVEEYLRRKDECTRHALSLGLKIIDGDYDHDSWLEQISGLENEPERGARCLRCFNMRLLATARVASENNFGEIATTLGSSRWKDLTQISQVGQAAATLYNINFLDKNWRKEGLSERRRELLRENNFYNQTYCGCEFSRDASSRLRKME